MTKATLDRALSGKTELPGMNTNELPAKEPKQ
jgi:hypothetical protein